MGLAHGGARSVGALPEPLTKAAVLPTLSSQAAVPWRPFLLHTLVLPPAPRWLLWGQEPLEQLHLGHMVGPTKKLGIWLTRLGVQALGTQTLLLGWDSISGGTEWVVSGKHLLP